MSETKPPVHKSSLFAGKNKWYWIGGAGGAAIIYFYVRKGSSSSSPTDTSADTSDTDTSDTTGYVDDGYSDSGYGDYSAASGVSPSLYGYVDPSTGQLITGVGATSTVTAPGNNAQWAQQAAAYLAQSGYDETSVLAALGIYLAGGSLSSDQLQIVQAAIGVEGYPPSQPPAPHTAPPSGQSAAKALAAPSLKISARKGTGKKATQTLSWNKPANTYQFHLYRNGKLWLLLPGTQTTHTVVHNGYYQIVASPVTAGGNVGKYKSSPMSNGVTASGLPDN